MDKTRSSGIEMRNSLGKYNCKITQTSDKILMLQIWWIFFGKTSAKLPRKGKKFSKCGRCCFHLVCRWVNVNFVKNRVETVVDVPQELNYIGKQLDNYTVLAIKETLETKNAGWFARHTPLYK